MKAKGMHINSLRDDFANLGEEYERKYELTLTKKVNMMEVSEAELKDIVDTFNAKRKTYGAEKREREEKIAYAALYCLSIFYRHSFDGAKFQKIATESSDWCRQHRTFQFLEITLLSNNPVELRDKEEVYLKVLDSYRKDYPNNAGYVHGLANLYANVCEFSYKKREYFRRNWQEKAEEAVNRAISLDPNYALYYCTKGRIAMINGHYDEADALFETAIQKENSAAKDGYSIRISRYLSYRSQVQMLRTTAQAQEQIDALKTVSISNIEILTFFPALLRSLSVVLPLQRAKRRQTQQFSLLY